MHVLRESNGPLSCYTQKDWLELVLCLPLGDVIPRRKKQNVIIIKESQKRLKLGNKSDNEAK